MVSHDLESYPEEGCCGGGDGKWVVRVLSIARGGRGFRTTTTKGELTLLI